MTVLSESRYISDLHLKASVFPAFAGCMLITLSSILLAACASIGNPSGGPRDEDPPRFISANPPMGATGVQPQRITLQFNELVNVKDAFTNVIISPLSSKIPKVSSQGSKVLVDFQESLLPNTTYTIDFGNSIEDNNEANKLDAFAYTFSTGPEIDSLRIAGFVLGAEDLEARSGLIVGLYDNPVDTAFMRHKPMRVARTDDRGRFIIRGVAPGSYRIYALGDADADYHYANPEEEIAFLSDLIIPSSESITVNDTLRNILTGNVDTIIQRMRTRFLPNSLLLRSFTSTRRQQYIKEAQRIDSTRLQFIFNTRQESLPTLSLLNPNLTLRSAVEHSQFNDTITYWLRGSELVGTDTLRLAISYENHPVGADIELKSDTLSFITKHPRKTAVKKHSSARLGKGNAPKENTEKSESIPMLGITTVSGAQHDVNRPIIIEFDTPLVKLDNYSAVHLFSKEPTDSVYSPMPGIYSLTPEVKGSLRRFALNQNWDYAHDYRLQIDSLAATGIYGLSNSGFTFDFKTKSEDDYCSLSFDISGWPENLPAFVELLNQSDKPIISKPVVNSKVKFEFLTPGKYYARIYEDRNANGRYDAGELADSIQPDVAYYYPKAINLKKNWDQNETWEPFSTPVDLQKPAAIKKNKPAADKRKKQEEPNPEDEDEIFDPNANPFDPHDKERRKKAQRLR